MQQRGRGARAVARRGSETEFLVREERSDGFFTAAWWHARVDTARDRQRDCELTRRCILVLHIL